MSGAIMEKVWGLFGMDTAEEKEENLENNYDVEEENENEIEDSDERKIWGRKNSKVVSMPQVQQVKMVISQPTTFEQSEYICDLLKDNK